jgi:hypothetical protein
MEVETVKAWIVGMQTDDRFTLGCIELVHDMSLFL